MLKTKDKISVITLLLGLVTIAYGVVIYLNSGSQYDKFEIVDGKVINYVKSNNNLNVPVIEYKSDSLVHTLTYNESIGTFPKENRVKVRYNLEDPEEAELYESYREIGIPISIITIGILIFIFGGTMYYYSSKSK